MSTKTTLDKLPQAIDGLLTEFLHSSFDQRQDALQAGAEFFRDAVAAETPKDTGEMAQSWQIKTKYKDLRYVGNSRTAKGVVHRQTKGGGKGEAREGVPLSNVLEYSDKSPHNGFIRRCFDSNEAQIYQTIKNNLKNGG